MICDPLGDRPLQRCAFVLALQFPEGFPAQMRDVWLLSFPHAVTRNIDVLSEVPTGAIFAPVIAAHGDGFRCSLLLRLTD